MTKPSSDLPLGKGVRLIQSHPAGLYALDKPIGIKVHPNESASESQTLLSASYDFSEECYHWEDADGKTQKLYLLHRIDAPTSGVLLVCAKLKLAQKIREAFASQEVQKTYLAVVGGIVRRPRGEWSDQLGKSKHGGKDGGYVRMHTQGEQKAVTAFHVLKRGRPNTGHLIELTPKTGRTHQLRVQCAKHGYPIIGDRTYGDFKLNERIRKAQGFKRLALHAHKVRVCFNDKGQSQVFEAQSPMPEEFGALV